MSIHYNKTPSEILGIDNDYLAYCFDEACLVIRLRMQDGEKPIFREDIEQQQAQAAAPKRVYRTLGEYMSRAGFANVPRQAVEPPKEAIAPEQINSHKTLRERGLMP